MRGTRYRPMTGCRSVARARALVIVLGVILVAPGGPASASSVVAADPSPVAPLSGSAPAAAAPVQAACGPAAAGSASCLVLRRTDIAPRTLALVTPATPPSGYGPADLLSAYTLAAASSGGTGVTVAIVDAFDLPTAEADQAAYRSQYGLPACTSASGCFRKVDQNGGTSYPVADSGWGQEIALDIEMVAAICPHCRVLLVEATTSSLDDLGTAVNTAVGLGATFVSNSYTAPEAMIGSDVTLLDTAYYTHPGVVITASAGDAGYVAGPQFPAISPHVVAVGGTRLVPAANARGWTETAWSLGGGGCSSYEPKPTWQADPGCAHRTNSDVSAVADPNFGVAVFETDPSTSVGAWWVFGGTSVSSPIIASVYALAGTPTPGTYPAEYPYLRGGLYDVTSGSNGSCGGSYLCTAGVGFDGSTGLGTPNGVGPFLPVTKPGAPTGAAATPGNASAAVTWSAPASNGGGTITGYAVTSSPGARTCTTTGALGCTVSALVNGTPYTFTVTATNAIGTGAASSPSTPVTPRTVPGAPTGVAAVAGNAAADVTWSAPASNGGSAITGYTVTSNPDGLTCTTTAALGCTVIGLANGTPYTFTVTATNVAGTGPASSASTPVTPRTIPGAPIGVTAVAGDTSADVSWSAPVFDGGSAITGYAVTSSPGGRTCTTSGALGCTVGGLTNGVPYTFTVTATNAAGTGPASSASTPVSPRVLPGAPTGVGATPGDASALVSWAAPASDGGSAITGYAVTSTPGSRTCTTSGALSCTVSGLTNGLAYGFTVTATNAAGTGPASSASTPVTPSTVPGAPTGVTAAAGNASAQVSWTAPASDGGSPVSGYVVTAAPGGAQCSTGGALTCPIAGLANGTPVTFTVVATNANGAGPASAASAAVVPTTGVVTAGIARTSIGTSSASTIPVTVSWSTGLDAGGVASYALERRAGTGAWTAVGLPTPNARSITVAATPGVSYAYRVRATTTGGAIGAWITGPAFRAGSRQNGSSLIRLRGTAWLRTTSGSPYGGSLLYASLASRTATTTFTGRGIAWVGVVGKARGWAEVWVDGRRVATVNLYARVTTARRIVWSTTFAASGTHTVMVKVLGRRSSAATGTRVDLDAFLTLGP